MIHKNIAPHIIEYDSISDRVASIRIKISTKQTLKCIQCYAPTSAHPDEEIESFYEDLATTINKNKNTYMIVMGDLNAKLGKWQDVTEESDERNDRGYWLLEFPTQNRLYAMNSFIDKKKQRKWTDVTPKTK